MELSNFKHWSMWSSSQKERTSVDTDVFDAYDDSPKCDDVFLQDDDFVSDRGALERGSVMRKIDRLRRKEEERGYGKQEQKKQKSRRKKESTGGKKEEQNRKRKSWHWWEQVLRVCGSFGVKNESQQGAMWKHWEPWGSFGARVEKRFAKWDERTWKWELRTWKWELRKLANEIEINKSN
jgi:hypothetical protein